MFKYIIASMALLIGLSGCGAQSTVPSTPTPTPETPTVTQPTTPTTPTVVAPPAPTVPEPTTVKPTTPAPVTPPAPVVPSGISLAELAKHSSASDCWIVFNNAVYDVTSYVPKHPGGAGKIAPYCGSADGFTAAITQQHAEKSAMMVTKNGISKGSLSR